MSATTGANRLIDAQTNPDTSRLVAAILAAWPEHERYLATNFGERDPGLLAFTEKLSGIICRLASGHEGGLDGLARDYRFLCEDIVLPEEMYFRRHDRYRLTKFEDALSSVYANTAFMTRYMSGLLVSDAIWINHCRCMQHYAQNFLPGLESGASLLEIGPGHGLLLFLATEASNLGPVTAWDISDASLKLAAHTLDVMKAKKPVSFEKRNIFDPSIMSAENESRFGGVVFSEVLEHVEQPLEALRVLHHLCRPGGRVWINVPANSPAPDHLYLVRRAEDAAKLAREAGFDVVDVQEFPTSGTTLERAIKRKLTISCVITGQKKAR
jgi:2-polyprenyl-3-methyl-5-hydroxy-6-metoxy-1,4-benzoquinol methylase